MATSVLVYVNTTRIKNTTCKRNKVYNLVLEFQSQEQTYRYDLVTQCTIYARERDIHERKHRTRRQMWVEFVVGSRPCSERFFSGCSGFPSPQKPTFPNSNSIWIIIKTLYHESLAREIAQALPVLLTLNKLHLHFTNQFSGRELS